jgi:hypothetical protein
MWNGSSNRHEPGDDHSQRTFACCAGRANGIGRRYQGDSIRSRPAARPSQPSLSCSGTYRRRGTAVLQIEGREPQSLPTGAAFYEPAETVIARFDNASLTEPMKFIAYYLIGGDEPLIEMLPEM